VALGRRQIFRTVGYGTQPGNAAACFTQFAICASSSRSPSWMDVDVARVRGPTLSETQNSWVKTVQGRQHSGKDPMSLRA
jgi:hypothetical protein